MILVRRVSALAALTTCAALSWACVPPALRALGPLVSQREVPPDATLSPQGAHVVLRRAYVADFYYWLRTKALDGEALQGFDAALSTMKELRQTLASDLSAWEELEVPLGEAASSAELVGFYERLPEFKESGDHSVPLRALGLRLAQGMVASEAVYRAGGYAEHAALIEGAAKDFTLRVSSREEELFGALEREMGASLSGHPVVITLVAEAPYPAAFAADSRGRVMACFLRVRGLTGADLVESVLHEVLHARDEMGVRDRSTLNTLRQELAERGIDPGDANVEMALQVVMFAEAASLVRRYVEPAHRSLGERGFYGLFVPAEAVVAAWTRHVELGEAADVTAAAIASALGRP